MAKCSTCGAPVNLAPDGEPKYRAPRRQSPTVAEIKRKAEIAAVRFANDYGPLPAANAGEDEARKIVLSRLEDALAMHGLRIAPSEI